MFVNLLVSYHSWFVSNVLAYWLNGSTNQDAPWQRGSPSLPHFVRWEFYRILAKKNYIAMHRHRGEFICRHYNIPSVHPQPM